VKTKHIWTAAKIIWLIVGILLFSLLVSIFIKTFFIPAQTPDVSSVHGLIPKIFVIMISTTAVVSVLMITFFLALIVLFIYLAITLIMWLVRKIIKWNSQKKI